MRPAIFAAPHRPEYEHTQRAPLYLMILAPGLIVSILAAVFSRNAEVATVSLIAAGGLTAIAFSIRSMRVVDEGTQLAIRYGPLPFLRKRIPYSEIHAAEPDRTAIIDGWGIHWMPGRGWTYNLWGFDCVRLSLADGRTIRIGTDDRQGLTRFLNRKIGCEDT